MRDPNAAQKAKAAKTKDLLLRLARHVLNPDEINMFTWGVNGVDLLVEVRRMFPKEYDRYVKGKIA